MKTAPFLFAPLALLLGSAGGTAQDHRPDQVARTTRPFAGGPKEFRFVVIGDRTGQHRPGIFQDALAKVDQLRPDFVINIGDLIEGKSENARQIENEWDEVTTATQKLDIPFFYVPGNHDLTNNIQLDIWRKRLGADYYSFTYKDALFLVLNTEDPPQPRIARRKLLDEYGPQAMATTLQALQGDPARAQALFARDARLGALAEKLRGSENVAFSRAQIDMVRKALQRNRHARWTFVLMHRPAWKVDSPEFREIEALLHGRDYTVLAGHFHRYAYETRRGHDYVQLGVTGGTPGGRADDPAVQDHIMWVSVSRGAPRISNIRLDGIFAKQGPVVPAAITAAPIHP